MPGRARQLIDQLIAVRAQGNRSVESFLIAHLVLQGINPADYTTSTRDDPETVRRLEDMLRDFGG